MALDPELLDCKVAEKRSLLGASQKLSPHWCTRRDEKGYNSNWTRDEATPMNITCHPVNL
jgi:hypothetical protein